MASLPSAAAAPAAGAEPDRNTSGDAEIAVGGDTNQRVAAANVDTSVAPPGAFGPSLYRHALESVFAFCSVRELAEVVTTVSRDWREATLSMKSLGETLFLHSPADCLSFTQSRLMHHIDEVSVSKGAPLAQILEILSSVPAPRLKKLTVALQLQPALLRFPPGLTSLNLKHRGAFDEMFNAALEEAANLQSLNELILYMRYGIGPRHSFDAISNMRSLQTLELLQDSTGWYTLSPAQIGQLRDTPSLTSLRVHPWSPSFIAPRALLALPHKWTQLKSLCGFIPMDDEVGSLLSHIPELTHLEFRTIDDACTHVDWLAGLPNLTSLRCLIHDAAEFVPRLLSGVRQCVHLRTLSMSGQNKGVAFTSDQLGELLASLSDLRQLTLSPMPDVASLAFLRRSPLLTHLSLGLFSRPVPVVDFLPHLLALPSLEDLMLGPVTLDRLLTPDERAQFTPPCRALPQLRKCWFKQH